MSEDNKESVAYGADRARQMLSDECGDKGCGFDMYFEIENCSDYSPKQVNAIGPSFARIRVDASFLAMVQRKNDFCRAENVTLSLDTEVKSVWESAPFHQEIEDWFFFVDDSVFRIEGHASGAAIVEFTGIRITQLENWLKGNANGNGSISGAWLTNQQETRFQWHGEALFYAIDNMEKLLGNVLMAHPEVGAKQVSIDMGTRIRESGAAAHEPTPVEDAQSARRRRIGML